jgi:hypothetical protein
VVNVLVLCMNALTFVPRSVLDTLLSPLIDPMKARPRGPCSAAC